MRSLFLSEASSGLNKSPTSSQKKKKTLTCKIIAKSKMCSSKVHIRPFFFFFCSFLLPSQSPYHSLPMSKTILFFDEILYMWGKDVQGLALIGDDISWFLSFQSVLRWVCEPVTLRMFALKACCQKPGGSDALAHFGWEVRWGTMNGPFREKPAAGSAAPYPLREERWKWERS